MAVVVGESRRGGAAFQFHIFPSLQLRSGGDNCGGDHVGGRVATERELDLNLFSYVHGCPCKIRGGGADAGLFSCFSSPRRGRERGDEGGLDLYDSALETVAVGNSQCTAVSLAQNTSRSGVGRMT